MEHVAHWDEVEESSRETGHLAGTWRDLGDAVGSVRVGLQRIEIPPGKWSTPAHVEGAEEEIFFVLSGSGLSWQDGEVFEVGPGDCLVHLAGEQAHTLRAGTEGLDVLAFGQRVDHGNTHLPRAGLSWMWPAFVDATTIAGDQHPWNREAAAGEPEVGEPGERPPRIVNVGDVEGHSVDRGDCKATDRDLASQAGSLFTGLSHVTVSAGRLAYPPHCHSAEEEMFVVLDGEGVLELGEKEQPVNRGHVVARPPGTGVAHSFRGGDSGLTYLAYGTREPNDIAYYPRSNKVSFRGVKLIARIEKLDYWDGEEA